MTILGRRTLRVASACAMLTAWIPLHAAGGDTGRLIERLRAVDADIVAATRSVEASHAEAKAPDAKLVADVAAARRAVDMIARDAATGAAAADANLARKRAAVARLLVNLEHARDAATDAALPVLVPDMPSREKLVSIAAGARTGADCAHALTIAAGQAVDTVLSAAGADRSALWLRVAPSQAAFYRVDTAASALDTDAALFGATCPANDAEARARGDDEFGLAAAVSFDATTDRSLRYVRIRNLGGAGRVIARVAQGAAFSGHVADERNGHPLDANVAALTPDGDYTSFQTSTDDNGFYLLVVDPGSYYALASAYAGTFVPEIFPDVPCGGLFQFGACDFGSAVLLTMTDGLQQPNINFALNIGGQVGGVVRDRDSGTPLGGGIVTLLQNDAFGTLSTYTDDAGRYTFAGLPAGNYRENAAADGYGSEIWAHIDCRGVLQTDCDRALGTPIAVARDQLTQGIDFDLPRQASIHVAVSMPGAPDYTYWYSNVYDLAGNVVASGSGYSTNATATIIAVPPGSYRVTVNSTGFFSQLWNGIDCDDGCVAELSQGTIVTVARGAEADLSFAPVQVPTIAGTITLTSTGAPLPDISVIASTLDGNSATTAYTDSDGRYTLYVPNGGDYYVFALDGTSQGAIYPTGACPAPSLSSCDLSNAIALPVAYGASNFTGIDIALAPDGSVSGHVALRTPPGMTLAPIIPSYAGVGFWTAGGQYGGSTNIDVNGDYTIAALGAGTWYATVSSGDAFAQAWNGVDCDSFGCAFGVGTPLTVASGQVLSGIDFDPVPLDYVFGRVIDAGGAPVANTAIDLWSAASGEHCGVALSNADGYYAAHDDNGFCGDHYVSTDVPDGYINQVFDGIACPAGSAYDGLCDVSGGTIVPALDTPDFRIANFDLGARVDPIFRNGFDP